MLSGSDLKRIYHYPNSVFIKHIWSYLAPYKSRFFIASLFRVAADIAWLYPPYAFALIIEYLGSYLQSDSLSPLYIWLSLTFVAIIIRYIGIYIAKTLVFNVSEQMDLDAQQKVVEHLMLLDMSWHETESTGSKFKRLDRGSDGLYQITRIWINNLIEITVNLVGVSVVILAYDIRTGIALTIFLISYYLLAHYYRRRAVAWSQITNQKEEDRDGLMFETINNVRSVKAMAMSPRLFELLKASAHDLYVAIKKRIFWFQTGNSIRNFYAHLFRFAVLIFIIYGIIQGHYAVGLLVLFVGYFDRVWQSMSELADVTENFAIAKNAVFRMQHILETPITIDNETDKVPFPRDWKKITFKEVSFSYHEKPVLTSVSFTIHRGEKLGIVGLSGAGKSTLFKLLLKEHESYHGDILFDETPLKRISKKDYFNYLAVVLQETELFNTSLKDNIVMTDLSAAEKTERVTHALETAHVDDFMHKLPSGLDTIIGEKGVRLSGGEKQRVGIARAVFKAPQILLLDEATSHLDIESEKDIQDSLHQFFRSVTAIVIAHRLTTIKEMDRIIVLEDGKVIESGNFSTLHQVQGRFYSLWEQQQL
jgi:ABC-type multidrug transport system fused ATPase/permease subunit